MIMSKAEYRKEVFIKRAALSNSDIRQNTKAIFDTIMNLDVFDKSNVVMCYVDFRNEVETRNFIRKCFDLGKKVIVPSVLKTKERNEIIGCEIRNLDEDLQEGILGIMEPKDKTEFDISKIDLVIVPGVAFDQNKNRIGYGAGYYDRFLRKVREDCFTIGVAFEVQIFNEIPVEEHDEKLDFIVTEKRIIS